MHWRMASAWLLASFCSATAHAEITAAESASEHEPHEPHEPKAAELCEAILPAADEALANARAGGHGQAIASAREALELALKDATACPERDLYRAHLAESVCDAEGARTAYSALLQDEALDPKIVDTVRTRVAELPAWEKSEITLHNQAGMPVQAPKLHVTCTWANAACDVTAQHTHLNFSRPVNARCLYEASAPTYHARRGAVMHVPELEVVLLTELGHVAVERRGGLKAAPVSAGPVMTRAEIPRADHTFDVPEGPLLEKWWFWTLVGSGAVVVVSTVLILVSGDTMTRVEPRRTDNSPPGVEIQALGAAGHSR